MPAGGQGGAEIAEPGRLVKVRKQFKGERAFARRPVGNAGANGKPVVAVRQAVVVGDAPRNRAHPLAIQSLQPIRVAHALGSAEVDARVSELHAATAGCELRVLCDGDGMSVHADLEQMNHGRRHSGPGIARSDQAPPNRGWWETTGVHRCSWFRRRWSDTPARTARCEARPPRRSSPAGFFESCR